MKTDENSAGNYYSSGGKYICKQAVCDINQQKLDE